MFYNVFLTVQNIAVMISYRQLEKHNYIQKRGLINMLVATQWQVVFHGTATKNGLIETTYVKTFSLEDAKEVYQDYIERARKANKKITTERYNRKKQERPNGKLDTIYYDEYGYQTYHVYVIEIDWENE